MKKLLALIVVVLLLVGAGLWSSPNRASGASGIEESFINKVLPWAQKENQDYETPISVAIGQAALESTWGTSGLNAEPNNNYLGLTDSWGEGSGYANGKVYMCNKAGKDCQWYNTYESGQLSFLDHGWGLKNYSRYGNAWQFKCDPRRFIEEVAKAGYAGDPEYAGKVINYMERYNLYQYDIACGVPPGPPSAPGKVDVYMLVDLSGSFADDLPNFKAQAPEIVASLKESNPDIRFGLGRFEDYPIPPFGYAYAGDKAYERLVDLTFDTSLVLNTIASLSTRYGGDEYQSQLAALYQAATGAGQDLSGIGWPGASIPSGQQASFRDGATKLFFIWTDAPFHHPGDAGSVPYPGPSFDQTVNAILALDPPKVVGISSGPGGIPDLEAIAAATEAFAPPGGVDCNADGTTDIAEGEPLVCGITSSGAGIAEAVIALVEAAGPLSVNIDIKPGEFPNAIQPYSEGVIAVAVLTTSMAAGEPVDFDATTVDVSTVRFGLGSATAVHSALEDVDADGDLDFIMHFQTMSAWLPPGSTEACLGAQTYGGQSIQGCDSVNIVPTP